MSTTSTHDSTVNSLYLAFYGRPADPAGMKFWAEQLSKANGDIDAIKASFANSEEAKLRFGNDTAADRITEIYQQLFNRDPDAGGLDFWVDAVSKGHASVADVAISVLKGAQGSDQALTALRQRAADSFTAEVEASGSGYGGIAAVEAARVLVRAVMPDATESDIDALVEASATLADVVTDNPEVMEALGTGEELLELLDSEEGGTDPVTLVETLAETARGASGDAHALADLMKGGGMSNLLKVLPEGMSLKDVKALMGKGGLPAALKKMFPDGVPANPGKPGKPGKPTEPDDSDAPTFGFHLGDSDSKLVLEAGADSVTGLGNADTLALKDYSSGAAQATAADYTGDGLAMEGNALSFDGALAAGLYQLSWQADTFTTAGGHLAAGSVLFAGGQDGLFVQEGFAVAKTTAISADLARAGTEQVNEAFIDNGAANASVATGGGHDLVADHGGTLAIVIDRFDSAAADLILGFDSGDDSVELTGAAASAIDANADGQIQWATAGAVEAATEGVSVTIDAQVVMGGTAGMTATLAALNDVLDVSEVGLNGELLVLARDDTAAALFQYVNKDDDGQIDADELTQIAMFADGAPEQADIVLLGAQAAPAP